MIRLKCAVGLEEDFNNLPPHLWPAPTQKPQFERVRILIQLYQAKDLLPSDSNGAADPRVNFYHFGSSTNSSAFPKTLNPFWNE